MPRYANKQDVNCKQIVEGLRQIPGVTVWPLGGATIDLCVGYKTKNYLFEVKKPDEKVKLKPSQEKFIENWTGQVNVVRELRDALFILGVIK